MGNNYNTTKLITKVVMLKGEKGETGSIDNLPTASPTTKGGIKVGSGLAMNGELLECDVNFDDYYTKAQTYTKTEVNTLLNNLPQIEYEVLETL